MEKFVRHTGLAVPLDRANVDTDAVIPKQFLSSIKRTGFGQNLFDEWRYLDYGEPYQDCSNRPLNPEFTLNLPRYAGASVLLARKNFGCGSSREHAVWALCEYGFRAVIAPEFADIFYQNSLKNGLLSIPLAVEEVDELFRLAAGPEPLHLAIDLPAQTVSLPNGSQSFRFKIDPFRKNCLMEGLDDIALTSRHSMEVETFQRRRWAANPWLAKRV